MEREVRDVKIAVIGGDRRAALLAELLSREGQRVHSFALEKVPLPAGITKDNCLTACVYAAELIVLPVPAEKGSLLNTPLSESPVPLRELWAALWPGQLVVGGGFGEESAELALRGKLEVRDLLRRPGFVTENAALTAEAAVGLLLRESERCLRGARCLVLGFGRIGKLLALRLNALGARVCVAARREADRALAGALGLEALAFPELEGQIGDFACLVNTIPAPVLGGAALCCVSSDALLLELASAPGGFDRELAANIGLRVLHAPGLPGRAYPLSSAELLKREIEAIWKEEQHG